MKNTLLLFTCCLCAALHSLPALTQDFLMQGWYWDYPKTAQGYSWADTMQNRAMDMSNAGFTYVWLPPLSRSSTFPNNNSNGYDIRDLFDLGEYGGGPTGFGTRQQVNSTISRFNNWGLRTVGDMIYNHRDGGRAENNPSVEGWIENFGGSPNCPYPSDRFRCYLPLGSGTGNVAGDYYIKISSKTGSADYYGKTFKVYITTNRASSQPYNGSQNETEPNGGGDCAQPSNLAPLNTDIVAAIDASGCATDEFKLTLANNSYFAAGDTLWIYLTNQNGDYSDHRIYGIWNATAAADVVSQLKYQTYTNFAGLPSGRGAMSHVNFRPNGNPTTMCGDLDFPYFFYDYDQSVPATRDTLVNYTKWMWQNVGIRGLRMDAVKHFPASFVSHLLNQMNAAGYNPGLVVGESISGVGQLNTWINDVYAGMTPAATAAIRVKAFDFPLRWSLKNACDQFGYDVRNVFNEGLYHQAGQPGHNIVTFINNHDYRLSSDAVQNNPMLAYAYLLTDNQIGLPTVFYPDYYGNTLGYMPNAPLKDQIDQLINIHRYYIYGSPTIDYLSRQSAPYAQNFITGYPNTTLMYQIYGPTGNDVIVAINFAGETLRLDQAVNTGTGGLAVGDTLVDLLGRSNFPYAIVSNSSQMYVELPPQSYSVWVRCNNPSAPDCVPMPNTARFKAKVLLEGAYQPTRNAMTNTLKNSGLLPLNQPYTAAPFGYNGTEAAYDTRVIPPNTTDWVLVELRSAADTSLISRQAAYLRADGTLLDIYGNEGISLQGVATSQNYFVAIKHRNHLPIMSSTPLSLPNATPFNFTQVNNIAGGAAQAAAVATNVYALPAADANANGIVSYTDYNLYAQQLGNTTYSRADLNLDGVVNSADFNLYRQNASRLALRVLR